MTITIPPLKLEDEKEIKAEAKKLLGEVVFEPREVMFIAHLIGVESVKKMHFYHNGVTGWEKTPEDLVPKLKDKLQKVSDHLCKIAKLYKQGAAEAEPPKDNPRVCTHGVPLKEWCISCDGQEMMGWWG